MVIEKVETLAEFVQVFYSHKAGSAKLTPCVKIANLNLYARFPVLQKMQLNL